MKIGALGNLAFEIERAFPLVEMPPPEAIRYHPTGCWQCDELAAYLEDHRNNRAGGFTLIDTVWQEMSCLSAQATRWILPHYLRYCLTPEAQEEEMKLENFVFQFSLGKNAEKETPGQFSLLTGEQIRVLIDFLNCLRTSDDWWVETFTEDLDAGIAFLQELQGGRV
jgi:hypothetical protein